MNGGYTPYVPPGMQSSTDYSPFYTWGQGTGTNTQNTPMDQPMAATSGLDTNALLAMLTKRSEPLTGFAKHANTFGTIADGLAGLGGMYLGYQNMKQQKKAFEFNKGVTNTNLNNSIMDYNRRLEGTLQNRALNNGQGAGWVSSELARFSARRS